MSSQYSTQESDMCSLNTDINCLQSKFKNNNICSNLKFIYGHGNTPDEIITVPSNFNIITFSSVGESTSASKTSMILLKLFKTLKDNSNDYTDVKNYKYYQLLKTLASPSFKIKNFYDMELRSHPPNCKINQFSLSFRTYFKNKSFSKSGVYSIPNSNYQNISDIYSLTKMDNTDNLYKNADQIFSGSDIYSTKKIMDYLKKKITINPLILHTQRITISRMTPGEDRDKQIKKFNLYEQIYEKKVPMEELIYQGYIHFNLNDLFKIFPEGGTFFIPLCRNFETTSTKQQQIQREVSAETDSIFKRNPIKNELLLKKIILLNTCRLYRDFLLDYNNFSVSPLYLNGISNIAENINTYLSIYSKKDQLDIIKFNKYSIELILFYKMFNYILKNSINFILKNKNIQQYLLDIFFKFLDIIEESIKKDTSPSELGYCLKNIYIQMIKEPDMNEYFFRNLICQKGFECLNNECKPKTYLPSNSRRNQPYYNKDNFKIKYLKYKQKYLNLKQILDKTKKD